MAPPTANGHPKPLPNAEAGPSRPSASPSSIPIDNSVINRILAEHRAASGLEAEQEKQEDEDPMERLRKLLPDAESLGRIPQIQAQLELEIMDIREEIAELKAELLRDQDPERMQIIQSLIGQLITQINLIRERASEAEAIVKTITKDIQRLDVAKRNLTGAMTAMKRWGMLLQAHAQLIELLPTKQYRAIANSLSAVAQLSTPLRPLTTNPPVAQVFKDVQQCQATVKENVSRELDAFFIQDPNKPIDLNVVKEACLVVDVLGADYRNHIIERYVAMELKEYRRIFSSSGEAGQLDNTVRRYAWFRRLLKTYDEEHSQVFPPSWETAKVLTAKFAEGTKTDHTGALAKDKPSAAVLLEAWQATAEWEGQMARRFTMPFKDIPKDTPGLVEPTSKGWTVTEVFEPHFKIFIDAQDKAISDMLAPYRGAKSRQSLEGTIQQDADSPISVLPSSTELFYFYAQTLEQCAKYTKGKGMKDLVDLFGKWLQVYSDEVLIASMKSNTSAYARKSLEGRPNVQELKNACLTLNTADYCMSTSAQLEEKLKDTIDPEFRDAVSFDSNRSQFMGVVSASVMVLLKELEAACEPAFGAILKTPWMNMENVSGRSAYVVDLVASVKSVAEVVRDRVELKKYIRSFADKAVGVIITRFTAAVIKSRPLKRIGAEQILLDVQAVKACLLDLPEPHTDQTAGTFSRYVLKATGQLETMLKVVLAPEDPPEGFVQNYCLLIGDNSFSNFQKILDMKGTPRSNQQKLLDIFLSVSSTQGDLSDTSFLTNLDMDPDKQAAGTVTERMLLSPTSGSLPALLRSDRPSGQNTPNRQDTPTPFGDFRRLVSFAIRGE